MTIGLKKKISIFMLILSLIFSIFLVTVIKDNTVKTEKNNIKVSENQYQIKLESGKIVLLENDKIIKEYNINTSILPGEDLITLSQGITVNSIEAADKLAEDFDG